MPGQRDDDGFLIEPYVFETTTTQPDGIRVQVVITVPPGAAWKDVPEAAEIAQAHATLTLAQINTLKERAPF